MKLKFLAKGFAPVSYNISGAVINGIDTSLFVDGSRFVGNEDTQEAGIYNMEWVDEELCVTLGQMTKAYQVNVGSNGWREGDWIDAEDYDPTRCYVVATNPRAVALLEGGVAEYFQDADGAWTVRIIEKELQEPEE
ncbi:hypothetical protein HW452_05035 [Halomonas aquamarina]|uniref:Uncharacterized protein n=1 Tax=Vreelandella aquamarina TaxID=77097 RepID=A0ACC5VSM8_9GAMM|nr:hypothetical protein [Halomonas aquamarina]MBZ5486885.1 hypothetical protein [Halomonas aquamarina]